MDMKKFLPKMDEEKLSFIFDVKERLAHQQISLEQAKAELKEKIGSVTAYEVAYVEQKLKEFSEDQCEKEDIQMMVAMFDGLLTQGSLGLDDNHPLTHYEKENQLIKDQIDKMRSLLAKPFIKNPWLEVYEVLVNWQTHLKRKQNQLYPLLEKRGFDRPTTTMWTLDDFVIDEIKQAYALLKEDQEEAFLAQQQTIIADLLDLMDKEETILYPTSLAMLTEEDFEDMKEGDQEIGFSGIEVAKPENKAGFAQELQQLLGKYGYGQNKELDVAQGKLTLEQINLIYRHLPVDLSYVDENELVRFYSDTPHRVFPRSKNVIGRDVKNCHPRKSVHIVEEIIEKFRSGEQSEAEFWINKPGVFIYIKYVAVRDEQGRFRGVLEMMQDCTHIRELEGSRTLLTWEDESHEEAHQESEPKDLDSITPATKLADLLAKKPDLKEALMSWNDGFKMLKSPLARVMIPKATVEMMAKRTGMDQDELIEKIRAFMQN